MTDRDLPKIVDLGERACVHQGERCWPCMTDGCYREPTRHVWYDDDDVEHAAKGGHSAPTGLCGCAFCGWPALGLPGPDAVTRVVNGDG